MAIVPPKGANVQEEPKCPRKKSKLKIPLAHLMNTWKNFAAAFTQCFYDYMAHPDAKERMDEMEIKLKARGIL